MYPGPASMPPSRIHSVRCAGGDCAGATGPFGVASGDPFVVAGVAFSGALGWIVEQHGLLRDVVPVGSASLAGAVLGGCRAGGLEVDPVAFGSLGVVQLPPLLLAPPLGPWLHSEAAPGRVSWGALASLEFHRL